MATPDDEMPTLTVEVPPLVDGQRLSQPEFHERYCRMPEDYRAELIEGVVHDMSSPVSPRHGRPFTSMNGLLYAYATETPGTTVQADTTTKISPQDEVQPDCSLLIEPDFGGRTSVDPQGFTTGCPELMVEISYSSLSIDLNAKKRVYESGGAREYLVYAVVPQRFHWFSFQDGRLVPLEPDVDGIYRSQIFPGLWLDPEAFLKDDGRGLMACLRRVLDSPEHDEFARRLQENRANRS